MIKVSSVFILIILICGVNTAYSQDYYDLYYQSDNKYSSLPFRLKTQVQSLEDFINRFNGYHTAYGDSVNRNEQNFITIRSNPSFWRTWRMKIIGSLLSSDLLKTDSLQDWKILEELVSTPHIGMLQEGFHAELPFRILSSEEVFSGVFILKFLCLPGNRYEWVIDHVAISNDKKTYSIKNNSHTPCNVESDFYLPPNSHGNGFLNLKRALLNRKNLNFLPICNHENTAIVNSTLMLCDTVHFKPVYFVFKIGESRSFKVSEDFSIIEMLDIY